MHEKVLVLQTGLFSCTITVFHLHDRYADPYAFEESILQIPAHPPRICFTVDRGHAVNTQPHYELRRRGLPPLTTTGHEQLNHPG